MSVVDAPKTAVLSPQDHERITAAQQAVIARTLTAEGAARLAPLLADDQLGALRDGVLTRLAEDTSLTPETWLALDANARVYGKPRPPRRPLHLPRRRTLVPWLRARVIPLAAALAGLLAIFAVLTALPAVSAESAVGVDAIVVVFMAYGWFVLAVLTRYREMLRRRRWARADRDGIRSRIDDELVPQLVREVLNDFSNSSFSATVVLTDVSGLEDLFDERYEVETGSGARLVEALTQLRAGSLGVFGPRGAGKSTLIEAAQAGRLAWRDAAVLGVNVPAPVRYEAREFVPFVFARLCLKVSMLRGQRLRPWIVAVAWLTRLIRAAAVIGLVVITVLALHRGDQDVSELWRPTTGTAIVAAALVWALAGWGRDYAITLIRRSDPLLASADENLEALRYLETRTQEWSSELSGTVAKLGNKRGRSLAAQALTLPEMTARYRDFMRLAVTERPGEPQRRVVVAIDEIDKMESAQEAARFLNEVKALFGQAGVFYLVSLSEDAAASFEQRGVGVRDVFESVFDKVVRIEPLAPDEARTLLLRRIVGMRPPFAELCHVISGGLPRELMRCARELAAAAAAAPPDTTIDQLVRTVLVERGHGRERALQASVVQDPGDRQAGMTLTWLRGLDANPTAEALLERANVSAQLLTLRVKDGVEFYPSRKVVEHELLGLAAWWYHAATVVQFAQTLDATTLDTALSDEQTQLLARGYLELAVSPALSWATVSAFRAQRPLSVRDYPGST